MSQITEMQRGKIKTALILLAVVIAIFVVVFARHWK